MLFVAQNEFYPKWLDFKQQIKKLKKLSSLHSVDKAQNIFPNWLLNFMRFHLISQDVVNSQEPQVKKKKWK